MDALRFFNPVDRRKFLKSVAALGAGAGALGAFGSDAQAQAKELRILMAGGTWKDWVNASIVDPFVKEKKVEIVWRLGLTHEPMVMAQRRNPQWDLIHINQNRSTQLGAMNLVMPYTEDRLPNLKKIHPSFRYEFVAGKVHTPYGLAVNTKHIKKPVDSWMALWDPEFKGRVAYPAWTWVGDEVFHAINGSLGGSSENIDPGIAKFKELFKANACKIINNVEHTRQLMLEGDIWICPHFGARTEHIKQAGAPVEFITPKEGGLSWVWNTAIIANRPKPSIDLAYELVNLSLSAERQIDFCRKHGYPPTNMEAMANLPPDLKKLELSKAQIEGMGKLQRAFDYVTQFAYRDQHSERWNKEVLAGT
jgi:spermidine/putrescine-binding protein